MNHRATRNAWLVAMIVLAGTAPAQAQPQAQGWPRPWERGVSAEDRRAAKALFDQAVELHEQLLRAQAVARYEEALARWENPHIRWNLALLMNDMGQYLRAHEHLERALAWGRVAFDEHDWNKLIGMQQMLLRQHLAVVEARCDQPGAGLALDGKQWFRGPGVMRQVVLPGEHVITASKPGYFPVARHLVLPAGTQGAVTVEMSVDGIFEQRRWASWKPWTVLAGGVAVGLAGAGLEWQARRDLAEARRTLGEGCGGAPPGGQPTCEPASPSAYRRSQWEHRIAASAMATAGTAAAIGLVLAFLNQPRSYRTRDRDVSRFELVPMPAPDATGVSARLRF